MGLPAALPVSGPPVTLGEGNTPVVRLRNGPDRAGANAAMARAVEQPGRYPLTSYSSPSPGGNPPPSSQPRSSRGDPHANEGYKPVAYELARDFSRRQLDMVVVPTSRADLLAGIGRGFRELAAAGLIGREPRLVAAETAAAAPFTAALRHPDRADQERTRVTGGPTVAFSLGEERPCRQGLDALWRGRGTAVAVDDEAIMAGHRRPAAGLLLEPSSAVASAVVRAQARTSGGLVVAIGTATGLKGLVG
ncbi:pyridoxal-phosphate dependent enzyme [Streptomyces sp. G7(2002)]|uniref:pyridoxal-phosphate dependent enzyme n=1 Tax=Streptomyces sp. G7(2002) TaxID=2971798 RepID=UPI00237E28E6|nr:pyridoxal-phosphate dependent enzyme [Streptomyces sp. G7(2002)]WDT59147.1 pyridoxal-phosphate dependent enzyme [Streptomyces sp. G7(2002)]